MIIRNPQTFRIRYALVLAVLISMFLIVQQYAEYLVNGYDFEFSWFPVSAKIFINYLLWVALFPIIINASTSISSRFTRSVVVAGIYFLFGLLFGLLHRIVSVFAYDVLYFARSGYFRNVLDSNNQNQLWIGWFSSFLHYWIIISLLYGINYYHLYIEKQRELSKAQLNALKKQLQPHFLFNTLNSITSLIDIDSKKAQTMLAQLGFLLRQILEHDNQHFISFEEELKYIRTYLEIEHTRFQDRMTVHIDVQNEVLNTRVPSLILQPLVENAVKHGISKCPEGGEIKIIGTSNQNWLEISISNDFSPMNGSALQPGYGIGILNIKKRLEQIYGKNFKFEQTSHNNRYQSKIVIPFNS